MVLNPDLFCFYCIFRPILNFFRKTGEFHQKITKNENFRRLRRRKCEGDGRFSPKTVEMRSLSLAWTPLPGYP